MNVSDVKHMSECFIKPKCALEESKQPYYLTPNELPMLASHYIQYGLLFNKPTHIGDQEYSTHKLLESLKESLSHTLVHFYPLAGQFATLTYEDQHECLIFIDCNKGPGVRFIHAALDMNKSDILSPVDVPLVVQSLFDHHKALNHDGHTRPLASVQVTELRDGVFIGCSMNHVVADGTTYWNFWNVWSEIHAAGCSKQDSVARLPVQRRWFPDGCGPAIRLPFIHPKEFITSKYESDNLSERIFHFSAESIARLKAKANEGSKTTSISSFQALTALVWRSIVRAKDLPNDQLTTVNLVANSRQRLDPPLPENYFGNCIKGLHISTTVNELLMHDLGWVASLLHESVINHNEKVVHKYIGEWLESPSISQLDPLCDYTTANSPRFDVYGNDFGLGKAVAVRSGYGNKFPGAVNAYPGNEGGGSVDLEICLLPDSMRALVTDMDFMSVVS